MKFSKFVVNFMKVTKFFATLCIGIALCLLLLDMYVIAAVTLIVLSLAVFIAAHICYRVYSSDLEAAKEDNI